MTIIKSIKQWAAKQPVFSAGQECTNRKGPEPKILVSYAAVFLLNDNTKKTA